MKAEASRFNVLNCGRRWGKTILGLDLVVEVAETGYPVGWFAPEYKLLDEAWRELLWVLEPITLRSNSTQKRIELTTGGIVDAWSFDRNPNAGRSRKYKRVVIDEAAHTEHLEEVWLKAILPTLTDYGGDAWFLSSPNGRNYFHKLHQRGATREPGWAAWTQTSYDNPTIPRSEIDALYAQLPEPFARQEYLAEFIGESIQALLASWWVGRLADPAIGATVEDLRRRGRGGRRRMAVDLALGTGRDRTVILVRDHLGVLDHHESSATGIGQAAGLVSELARKWGLDSDAIVYDAGGPGRDLPRYLEQYGIEAIPYHGSGAGGSRFANKRAKVAWRLRQRIDPERPEVLERPEPSRSVWDAPREATTRLQPPFAIPGRILGEKATEELTGLRYELKGAKIALENKDEFMRRLGRSPDFADALMMTFNTGD